ncbi:unnamed protein product [Allacma fusca]|uniref:Uncharacterized protein n=1 Tax=Allacma fusca TaxID=39272 RepID=A0A8J2PIR1_9HEXA|nr:unnamed protein product [Allacma fusca]
MVFLLVHRKNSDSFTYHEPNQEERFKRNHDNVMLLEYNQSHMSRTGNCDIQKMSRVTILCRNFIRCPELVFQQTNHLLQKLPKTKYKFYHKFCETHIPLKSLKGLLVRTNLPAVRTFEFNYETSPRVWSMIRNYKMRNIYTMVDNRYGDHFIPSWKIILELAFPFNFSALPISHSRDYDPSRVENQMSGVVLAMPALKNLNDEVRLYTENVNFRFVYCQNKTNGEVANALAVFYPLEINIWIGIALAITVLVYFLTKFYNNKSLETTMVLVGYLVCQAQNVNKGQGLLLLWVFVTFILTNSYLCAIESVLISPASVKTLKTFHEMVNKNYRVMSYSDLDQWRGYMFAGALKAKGNSLKYLQKMKENSRTLKARYFFEPAFLREMVYHQEKRVCVVEGQVAKMFVEWVPKLYKGFVCFSGQETFSGGLTFSEFAGPLHLFIKGKMALIFESGIYDFWRNLQGLMYEGRMKNFVWQTHNSVISLDDKNDDESREEYWFTLQKIQARLVFYFLLTANGISLLVLMSHISFHAMYLSVCESEYVPSKFGLLREPKLLICMHMLMRANWSTLSGRLSQNRCKWKAELARL